MLASRTFNKLHVRHPKNVNRLAYCLLSRRCYQDEALQWAQENRDLAQRCLEVPPLSNDGDDKTIDDLSPLAPLKSFEDYWKWRQWDFSAVKEEKDLSKAQALATHVMSAPLTVASQLLLPGLHESVPPHHKTQRSDKKRRRRLNYCCIGARSESTLPSQYWKEILVLVEAASSLGRQRHQSIDLTLDFVGPEILRRPKTRIFHGNSSITLRWPFNGKLHDYLLTQNENTHFGLSDWDACILFNPGLGHEILHKEWKPTVDLLLDANQTPRRPLLLTAHSALDAARETNVLCNYLLETAPLYVENPFASRITYQDAYNDQHVVRPNHYVCMIMD